MPPKRWVRSSDPPVAACARARLATCTSKKAWNVSPLEDKEEDKLDGAFDVRPDSRLGCQSHLLKDRLYVVEITRESRDAYFDEHPDKRSK